MVIILKEAKINGDWQFLGATYIKEDTLLYPILVRYGKQFCKEPMSLQSKIHMAFHSPEKARQFNSDSILMVRDLFPAFDRLCGCWPFDYPDVIRCPDDMEDMYRLWGLADIRMLAWRE